MMDKYKFSFILFFLLYSSVSFAGYTIIHNGKAFKNLNNIEVVKGDEVIIRFDTATSWYRVNRAYGSYSNLGSSSFYDDINYRFYKISSFNVIEINIKTDIAGNYLFAADMAIDSLATFRPLCFLHHNIFQISVREADSYIGYITELLNVPFLLGPKNITSIGHQADLKIGIDCAELAIYGRRRMGHKIPYCGPRKIIDFLYNVDSIQSGTIVHFGFQVSIVYKDFGTIGVLDDDDYLIHAYDDRVKIQKFADCTLNGFSYNLYEWR